MAWVNPVEVAAGDPLTETIWNQDVVANAIAGHALVSSLPGSPSDGQTIYYQSAAMASLGVVWTFRYRTGGGTYKWEFVGGAPLYVQFATSRTTTSGSYVALTDAVEVTNPLAGDYLIEHGAEMGYTSGGPGIARSQATIKLGSAAAADAESISSHGSAAGMTFSVSRAMYRTLASSMTLAQQYKSPGGVTVTVLNRWVQIRPVAVG
jgi:hypothetical protein